MSRPGAAFALAGALAALTGCSAAELDQQASWPGCGGFSSQADAQRAWERTGRPASADGDGDRHVCETLGGARGQQGACRRVRRVVVVTITRRRYPATADHTADAIAAGEARVLHIDRAGADANRDQSLAGIPTRDGFDRDEYPPATSREGGRGASVRYVRSGDNRGAGSSLGEQISPYCNGQAFRIRVR